MSKKIKLAVIRDNESEPCPFGLVIAESCALVGEAIDNMMPIAKLGEDASEEEKAEVIKANQYLLMWRGTGEPCKYAAKLFPNKQDKIDCSYGDTAAGVRESGALLGSPFYAQHFSGISLDNLMGFPISSYGDFNTSRNAFYGMYSLSGEDDISNMIVSIAEALIDEDD